MVLKVTLVIMRRLKQLLPRREELQNRIIRADELNKHLMYVNIKHNKLIMGRYVCLNVSSVKPVDDFYGMVLMYTGHM
jgi:hypothetical protein